MRTRILFAAKIAAACMLAIGMAACSGSKKATKKTVGTMLKDLPCQKEGRSDKKNFRAYADAKSQNMNMARQKAMTQAKANLAGIISTTIKTVNDSYMNERQFGDKMEFEAKFESLTREIVNQQLNNIEVVCEEQSVTKDGMYNKFIAIQISMKSIAEEVEKQITRDQKLQIDYDKMKFEEIFNREMDKLEAESGY
jgi:hypothetical protein